MFDSLAALLSAGTGCRRGGWRVRLPILSLVAVLLLPAAVASPVPEMAAPGAKPATSSARATPGSAERAFERARHQGAPELYAFLYRMPKGADLHMHLSGAVYAETFLRDAAHDGLCVDRSALAFARPSGQPLSCPPGQTPASTVAANQHLYDELIDAFSMRDFVAHDGDSGHDHFFDTFDKFGGTSKEHLGEWIDEVAARAASQNEQYLELMHTPDFKEAAALSLKLGYDADFAAYRKKLLDAGLRDSIPAIRAELDRAEASRREIEHCGTPAATPACQVEIRFLYQVLRGLPKEIVFAQTLLAFETASADPRFVGLNFVMPEDGYTSMNDYRLHMQMLDVLHAFYPKVHISLHAGELAPGLVPPDGLTFHIRSAIEQGHAERIGHGVDILYEDRPQELLKEMAARRIMVEINLTSNDVILGIRGSDHPLPIYRSFGVPVALSTDDEGVSRINLTNEFVRATVTYSLSYDDLKQMVRTSLEHSFLPGESLWQPSPGRESLDRPVAACRGQLGAAQPAGACATFLKDSEKARQQWELERRFHVFESEFESESSR